MQKRHKFVHYSRIPASEIESSQIPQTDAKISMELLRDGVPVTTVLLGEELELRWRIESTSNLNFFTNIRNFLKHSRNLFVSIFKLPISGFSSTIV